MTRNQMKCVFLQEFAECITTIFSLDCESRLICDKTQFDILKWITVSNSDNNNNISAQKLSGFEMKKLLCAVESLIIVHCYTKCVKCVIIYCSMVYIALRDEFDDKNKNTVDIMNDRYDNNDNNRDITDKYLSKLGEKLKMFAKFKEYKSVNFKTELETLFSRVDSCVNVALHCGATFCVVILNHVFFEFFQRNRHSTVNHLF